MLSKHFNCSVAFIGGDNEKDDIEDDRLVAFIDSVDISEVYVYVKLNESYSVTAEYIDSNKRIIALDKDKIKRRYVTDECDETCWTIKGGYIDVTLKYDK